MKTLYKISRLGVLAAVLSLCACGTEDEIGTSLITNYAVINYEGGDPMFVPLGSAFEETAIATIDGTEIPYDAYYTGRYRGAEGPTLDTSIADVYTAEYSAVNNEGFVGTETRQIIVANTGDLVTSIEGVYRATAARNGMTSDALGDYTNMEYVLIWKNEDGTYEISDAFAGFYDIGRAYGYEYITPGGIIVANDIPSNDFEFPEELSNMTFGGEATITSMEVNPDDKTIDMVTIWQADAATTYTFEIHLEQVQF